MIKDEVLFQNYDIEPYVEEVKEAYEEMNDEEMSDEEAYEVARDNVNDDWKEIYYSALQKAFPHRCLMYGYIGRWNGQVAGWEVGDFDNLFYQGMKDCEYWELGYDEDGNLYIKCSHHDGDNMLYFRALTEKGVDAFEAWESGEGYNDLEDGEFQMLLMGEEYSVVPHLLNHED